MLDYIRGGKDCDRNLFVKAVSDTEETASYR